VADTTPAALAKRLLAILAHDRDELEILDRYIQGDHDDPYMPDGADAEYQLLADRAKTNVMPLLIGTPAQAMYVDDYRAGLSVDAVAPTVIQPIGRQKSYQMRHWQDSGLDAKQASVYRGAFGFGHSFVLTEKKKIKGKSKAISKGLSAMKTSALFEDPANDIAPYAVITVVREARTDVPGKARMWIGADEHQVTFESLVDEDSVKVGIAAKHGSSETPVTRFACAVDLEGRTCGVVAPMKRVQDRINQTIFDLLVTQTYASFKVRWATGMAPPLRRDAEGEIVLDAQGQPIPIPVNMNQKRMMFGEDENTKFGTLDETPLGGFIESADQAFRHFSALSQTPPHYLLGQIANLSAEALQAAETSLARKIAEFMKAFGEAWERVFRVAAEIDGDTAAFEDESGEVIWRDMEQRSMSQSADALGKLAEQIKIPFRGLWNRVPGVTAGELAYWEQLAEEQDAQLQMAQALNRASGLDPTGFGPEAAPALPGAIA
jgi:hypothetical protein